MENNVILTRLEKQLPGVAVQRKPFGRATSRASIWVEMSRLLEVARFLKEDSLCRLDILELIGVAEIDESLVVTYFLRSSENDAELIVRVTVVLDRPEAAVEIPSVVDFWMMADPMEQELSELFGIRFTGNPMRRPTLLPQGWLGFPLRKSYVFPVEFMNISHMRFAGTSEGAEGSVDGGSHE